MGKTFKESNTFERRKAESTKIMQKYPDRIPIIVERASTTDPDIIMHKYLIPRDFTLGEVHFAIRKNTNLTQTDGIFFFINNKMLTVTDVLGNVYSKERDDDGFLYVKYQVENAFG